MSTRISDPVSGRAGAAALALLLTACNQQLPDKAEQARAEQHNAAREEAEGRIECALEGADFTLVCTIDRTQTQDGLYLTIRHPDGGFRRLRVATDGTGVTAADGAEPARVTPIGTDRIEVALGSVRYRLPATVRAPKAP